MLNLEELIFEACREFLNIEITQDDLSKNMINIGIDSLGVVEIAMFLEDNLNIEISDEKLESFNTLQDFIDYIKSMEEIKQQL